MSKLRFWPALAVTKLATWYLGKTDTRYNDKPGVWGYKIDPDFLAHVAKPDTTVVVTGTNGKTSITSILSDILSKNGLKVASNNWGPNLPQAEVWAFADGVSYFNKPKAQVAVLEADEVTAESHLPPTDPNYVIITNLSRDSMFRNAYPEYIQSILESAINMVPESTLILNADDPLSCFIGKTNRKIYFGVEDQHYQVTDYILDDFNVCPHCNHNVRYLYRNYRHIGRFVCPNCGMTNPDIDYLACNVTDKEVTIKEKDCSYTVSLYSAGIHNVYNTAAIVAFLRDYGMSIEEVQKLMSMAVAPSFREDGEIVNGKKILIRTVKSQNPVGTSVSLESVANEPGDKAIIICVDEDFTGREPLFEVGTWIYDIQYELLNKENIKKIVFVGDRCLDHLIRCELAGIPRERIETERLHANVRNHIDPKADYDIYIMRNNFGLAKVNAFYREIVEMVKEEAGNDR